MRRGGRIGIALALVAAVVIGVGVVAMWDTYLGRAIRCVSVFAVRNSTSRPVEDVTISAEDTSGTAHTRDIRRLDPGDTARLAVRTHEMYLRSVAWQSEGHPFTSRQPGQATKGEIYLVELLPADATRGHYASE